MPGNSYQIAGENVPLIQNHMGGTCVIPAGGTVSLTLPDGVVSLHIIPEGGAVYYAVNATAAGTVTMGYVPADTNGLIFEAVNITSVSVFAAAGVQVHTQYYG
jgi:hypothetical protein